ncbi:MAG: tRNA (adenosine(37)-N6)-dimethylallyltransferase MiaA [Mariprofundaceae bacterium]|nr:tRNA (adenosine(37)-N6)-dimethylallyltransferase MiaA [Mariprofundaceae bacterium]
MTKHRAIALMGATGTGKSALAITLAQQFNTSIISCDSMQLYRGLDIGTAKASLEERASVPHYLLDCADIQDIWSAQRWANEALSIIQQENKAGRTPIIVGGTGMYLRALLEGFADIPPINMTIREHFLSLQQEYGTPYLHQLLQVCDKDLAARLDATDSQRIMRGLCVFESTQKPLSIWQSEHEKKHESVDCPIFILSMERSQLCQRLEQRIDTMMQQGWLDEVRWLDAQNMPELHPALRAVGYRQMLDYLHGGGTLGDAIRDAKTATRRYAKRQVTWFKNQTPHAHKADAASLHTAIITQVSTPSLKLILKQK